MRRAFHFNHQDRGVDRIPSISKKKLLRKEYKIFCWAPSKRPDRHKLVDQSLETELIKLKKSKFELDLTEIVEFILDGYSIYTSILESFEKKIFMNLPISEFQRELYK